MAELAYALDSGSSGLNARGGSSPPNCSREIEGFRIWYKSGSPLLLVTKSITTLKGK